MDYGIQIFCRNIRSIRLARNLSIPEMARILELREELLVLLESGVLTEEMDVTILFNIYEHFGIKPSQLFGKTTP